MADPIYRVETRLIVDHLAGEWESGDSEKFKNPDEATAHYEHHLMQLLATIHRDGGHYVSEHGVEKATNDAIKVWAELMTRAESNQVAPPPTELLELARKQAKDYVTDWKYVRLTDMVQIANARNEVVRTIAEFAVAFHLSQMNNFSKETLEIIRQDLAAPRPEPRPDKLKRCTCPPNIPRRGMHVHSCPLYRPPQRRR